MALTGKSRRRWNTQWNTKQRRFESLEPKCLLAADVYISEFVASNDSFLDEDGDDPDWLEVFNAGSNTVDLTNWFLTDSESDLTKWRFPRQEIAPGESLVIFASDKDRAVAGSPLHANFKLSAGGEHLALSQVTHDPGGGSTIEVVSEFTPEYPQQVTDVSYGFEQFVDTTTYLSNSSEAKIFVPAEGIDPAWNELGFDDSGWSTGVASIGYEQSAPGFAVQQVNALTFAFENLAGATELFEGTGQYSDSESRAVIDPQVVPVIDFQDADGNGSAGRFRDFNLPFPGDNFIETLFTPEELEELFQQGVNPEQLKDDNFFVLKATASIEIPESGIWSFYTTSDDGVELWIDGESIIREDILTFDGTNGAVGSVELEAGSHTIELLYFEYAFGAMLELSAAQGEFTGFSRSNFSLVGDVENGGLEVQTSRLAGFAQTDLETEMSGKASSAFLRVPFDVEDPAAVESLTLKMQYDDGFVAYLNGEEIARDNAPDDLTYDSLATTDKPAADVLTQQSIDITEHISKLQAGENLLAIHGLNDAADSADFLLTAEVLQTNVQKGDTPLFFKQPTPGFPNTTVGALGFLLDDITISQPHGFYEEAFQTEFSAGQGTTIRYTTDGSEPTEENGFDYEGPITVDKTTTFRVRSFKELNEPSNSLAVSYLFIDDILTQTNRPAGWPSSRNGQTLNYGMDPDITESEVWGTQMQDALTQIPSMSIVMDQEDFVGSEGIYTNARSHGKEWERPASLELINPDGSEGFTHNMGIRVRGGFSRTGNNPKHAFRLFFREQYGDGDLDFPLFGDEGAESFRKIDLRTSQNYSWAFQGDNRNNFVRDVFSRDIQGEMGQPYTRSDYYHLYINGQYWGLFQTQERAEARYAASYFGGDADDYDVVKSAGSSGGYTNEATDGNLESYQRLWQYFQDDGVSDANLDAYWQAQGMNPDGTRNTDFERLLDVDNLIDYMIITYFTSDSDGPGSRFTRPGVNNYFGIYNRENPDGFKFFEHDSEHSLDTGDAAGANFNMVNPQLDDFVGEFIEYFNPHWMHEQLANNNAVYRQRFQDAVYNRMFNDGPLAGENALATLNSRVDEIDMAIIAESARWGDSKTSAPYTKSDWENAVDRSRRFIGSRTETVIDQFRSAGWYPEEGQPPQFSVDGRQQHGGAIRPTDKVNLFTTEILELETIMPKGSTWSYDDSGTDLGTEWRHSSFDDTTWNSGPGKLAYNESDAVTELNKETQATTVYFRSTFTVDDPTKYAGGILNILRDDGAIIYINGVEAGRSNMPAGDVDYLTLASDNVSRNEDTYFPVDLYPGLLKSGENTIAVEVHQYRVSSAGDLALDLEIQLGTADYDNVAIYYTTDGTDPRLIDGTINPEAQKYVGNGFSPTESGEVFVRSLIGDQWSVANRATFQFVDGDIGDVNQDGLRSSQDIDALASAVRTGENQPRFDLNDDQSVNNVDYNVLVDQILVAKRGDTNLDGVVNFEDFLTLSVNFGTAVDATWAEGDADGDGEVSFADFLLLSSEFGD